MRKSLLTAFVSTLLLAVFVELAAPAQERKGTITGHVTDTTRAVVQGARVELQPGGQTAVKSLPWKHWNSASLGTPMLAATATWDALHIGRTPATTGSSYLIARCQFIDCGSGTCHVARAKPGGN